MTPNQLHARRVSGQTAATTGLSVQMVPTQHRIANPDGATYTWASMEPIDPTRRPLRREFMSLFRRGVDGDPDARDQLAMRWQTLEPVVSDLLFEYSHSYLEPYRVFATWLASEDFLSRARAKPPAKRKDETAHLEAALALSQAPQAVDEARARRESAIVATRRPNPRPRRKRRGVADAVAREDCFVDVIDAINVHEHLVIDFMYSSDPITPKGVRDMNLLGSALSRQHTSLGGIAKYKTVAEVAASLLFGLVLDHPFHNGNKRTGLVTVLQFLDRHSFYLDVTEQELFDFLLSVADHRVLPGGSADEQVEAIAQWFREHLDRLDKNEYPLSVRDLLTRLQLFGCTFGDFESGHLNIFRVGYPRKRIAYHAMNEEVDPQNVHDIRRHFGLDEEHGTTSRRFYGAAGEIDVWINKYRQLLRQLAKY